MSLNRRQFVLGGGALLVCFTLPGAALSKSTSPNPGNTGNSHAASGNAALDSWIRIEAGGQVVVSAGKVEFGQGIRTALAQIAAEELDIDLSRVRMREVDTSYSPDESYTFSSISVQKSGNNVRQAAALARTLLIDRAAEKLSLPASGLTVSDGSILHLGKPAGVDYWDILADQSFNTAVPGAVTGKPADQYRLVGQSARRLDIPAKVFAQPAFLADLRMPDTVYARVVRPPRPGRALLEVDTGQTAAMPGVVKVVRDGSFLAVVAERELQATRAATQLAESCQWQKTSDMPDSDGLSDWLKSTKNTDYPIARRTADGAGAKTRYFTMHYSKPFLAHASIAPSSALALWDGQQLTVWSHSQGMYPLRGAIAHVLGLVESQVRCIHVESGGVYGHNGADDAACDAAAIAIQVPNRAVKLQWNRGDEFSSEPYGSAMLVSTRAGVDANGKIVDWRQEVWSCTHSTRPAGPLDAGNLLYAQQKQKPLPVPAPRSIPQPSGGADRNALPLYDFPALEVIKHLTQKMPVRVSALRGLGAFANVFAIESCMDELAFTAALDPLELRLKHLADERARAVLLRLRQLSGWSHKPVRGTGEGWGIGFAKYKNLSAYCAVMVILNIAPASSEVRLKKALAVVDVGLVINPDGVRAQIEGGIIQSASWTLKEQVRYDQSGILSRDWAGYPILKFTEVPDVVVEIMAPRQHASLGVAEAAQGPTAAAIANAIFHASGKRLRDMPLTAAKLKAARVAETGTET